MAILNGGALRQVRKNEYIMASGAVAFLSLTWHGAHSGGTGVMPGVFGTVYVADQVAGGQFDLYFCSTDCLRAFLNHCVDTLERKVRRKRSRTRAS